MNHTLTRSVTVCLGGLLLGIPLAFGNDLGQLLECRNHALLTAEPSTIVALGSSHGYDCRVRERERSRSVDCTGAGRGIAFDQRVHEFNLTRQANGGAVLAVAFSSATAALAPRVEREKTLASGQPLAEARIEQREDGVAELLCRVAGTRGDVGSIAGQLDFRGVQPIPAMRVCAAPLLAPERPQCVQTATGADEYLIEQLAAGDYYVTAYALENNPKRLFGAYTSTLRRCGDPIRACAEQRLQRVTVYPGDVRTGIDPRTLLPELPDPLRRTSLSTR